MRATGEPKSEEECFGSAAGGNRGPQRGLKARRDDYCGGHLRRRRRDAVRRLVRAQAAHVQPAPNRGQVHEVAYSEHLRTAAGTAAAAGRLERLTVVLDASAYSLSALRLCVWKKRSPRQRDDKKKTARAEAAVAPCRCRPHQPEETLEDKAGDEDVDRVEGEEHG